MATIEAKNKDCEKTQVQVLLVLIVIVLGGIFVCLLNYFAEKIETPSRLIDGVIYSMDKLREKLKERTLVMERDGSSDDSAYYKQVGEAKTELKLVYDKLIEIKIKLKNKQ